MTIVEAQRASNLRHYVIEMYIFSARRYRNTRMSNITDSDWLRVSREIPGFPLSLLKSTAARFRFQRENCLTPGNPLLSRLRVLQSFLITAPQRSPCVVVNCLFLCSLFSSHQLVVVSFSLSLLGQTQSEQIMLGRLCM